MGHSYHTTTFKDENPPKLKSHPKTKIFNMDPIGDEKRMGILDHFENLAKIFNQRLEIESKEKNPIRKANFPSKGSTY